MTTDLNNIAFEKIYNEFEDLSNLVLRQIDLLKIVFEYNEKTIPEEILIRIDENEKKIDGYENSIDKHIVKTIVLFRPVASDLRQLFAVYRMVINLERIGDLIVKISNYIVKINKSELLNKPSSVIHLMLKYTSEMLKNSLLSFINKDEKLALWTIKKDKEVDELNKKLLRKSIEKFDFGKNSQALLLNLVDIRTVISGFERIGDHTTNIAEASIYAILGTNVRHKDLKKSEDELL